MPSTFTTRYGFEQPAIGVKTGWGVARNADLQTFDDLFGASEDGIAALVTAVAGKAATVHTHAEDDVDGLVADLAALAADISGKAALVHSHVESDVVGLVSDLAGKAAAVHTHAQSDVTGLVAALAAKATVGGSSTQVEYNDGGALAGDSLFTWNKTAKTLSVGPLSAVTLVASGAIPSTEKPIFSYGASGIQRLTLGDLASHYFGDNLEVLHVYQSYNNTQADTDQPNMVEGHAIYSGAAADATVGLVRAGYFTFEHNDVKQLSVGVGLEASAISQVGSLDGLTGLAGSALVQSLRSSAVSPVVGACVGGDFSVGGEVTGSTGTSTATISLAQAVHTGGFVSNRTTVTLYNGVAIDVPITNGTGTITAKVGLQIGNFGVGVNDYAINVTGGKTYLGGALEITGALTLPTKTANTFFAGPTSGGAAIPAFRALVSADLPSISYSSLTGLPTLAATKAAVTSNWLRSYDATTGLFTASQPAASDVSGLAAIATSGKWSDLQNASAALTLANGGNASTFNQTSAVDWSWINTTAATSAGAASSSPSLKLGGRVWYNNADTAITWAAQLNAPGTPTVLAITNGVETAGSVVTLTSNGHGLSPGTVLTFANLTTLTWLNGQTARMTGASANTVVFTDPTAHGTQTTTAITGSAIVVPEQNLLFTLTGGFGNGRALFPVGSATGPSVGWAGSTPQEGFYSSNAGGLGISILGGSNLNAITINAATAATANASQICVLNVGNNSGANQAVGLLCTGTNFGLSLQGRTSTGVSNPAVMIGNQGSANTVFNATSGAQIGVGIGYSQTSSTSLRFEPASGTATFQALIHKYTINQTGGANGAVTGILLNAVETAVGGTHLLMDLQAGSAGTTSVFQLNNSGVATKYKAITTVGDGIPYEVGTADLTAQTAAKSATTLYTPTATGWYRITAYLKVTTAATTGSATSTLGGVTITYTDGTDSVAQSVLMSMTKADGTVATTNAGNSTTTLLYGTMAVYAKTAVAIQYAIAYASNTAAQMQYAARLRCEAM